MINSKIEKPEDESPRFIEAKLRNINIDEKDEPVITRRYTKTMYTRLFHELIKHIDHKPTFGKYEIKTHIWRSVDKTTTYIEIDIKRKCEDGGIMFYVLKKFIETLKEHYGINIWSILPAEENPIEGFITLNGGFEE